MSLLGDLVGDALSHLFVSGRTDRRLRELLEHGERAPATIDGIRVRLNDDTEDWRWGLTVHAPAGEFRAGVKQRLLMPVRLGQRVEVLHLDERAVIDDGEPSVGTPLKAPIEPGIDDGLAPRKRLERWTRTPARLVAAEQVTLFGAATENHDLQLELADGRALLAKRKRVPLYARHLLEPGTTLPVVVDPGKPDRAEVDWAAAAAAS